MVVLMTPLRIVIADQVPSLGGGCGGLLHDASTAGGNDCAAFTGTAPGVTVPGGGEGDAAAGCAAGCSGSVCARFGGSDTASCACCASRGGERGLLRLFGLALPVAAAPVQLYEEPKQVVYSWSAAGQLRLLAFCALVSVYVFCYQPPWREEQA